MTQEPVNSSGTCSKRSESGSHMSNPNCSETSAMLRIVGPNVDPDQFTQASGIPPTMRVAVGDISPKGTRPRTEGIWAIDTQGLLGSTELEDHLSLLIAKLPENFVDLIPNGARCEILCVWHSATGHGGPSLSPSVLSKIAASGITLDFDFYCDE